MNNVLADRQSHELYKIFDPLRVNIAFEPSTPTSQPLNHVYEVRESSTAKLHSKIFHLLELVMEGKTNPL